MLWLLRFDSVEGRFFERLQTHELDWIGAHILLFAGAVAFGPAVLAIVAAIDGRKGAWLAQSGAIVVFTTAPLLIGQYAIDFIMPKIAAIGGDALDVHRLLFSDPILKIAFYDVPDLLVIGLFMTHLGLFRSGMVSKWNIGMLVFCWAITIVASVSDLSFIARPGILGIGICLVPTSRRLMHGVVKSDAIRAEQRTVFSRWLFL